MRELAYFGLIRARRAISPTSSHVFGYQVSECSNLPNSPMVGRPEFSFRYSEKSLELAFDTCRPTLTQVRVATVAPS